MDKRWKILEADDASVTVLQHQLNISPAICRLLIQRGLSTYEEAKNFFRPSLDALYNPYIMKDMGKAVNRVSEAIERNEKILVYGDYDVDGTTSVAVMYSFLLTMHANLEFYIPHRYREGYGVSSQGITYAEENGFQLIISLDCGIKSIDLVAEAKKKGIDFIICDHHMPDEELPEAIAILNAKQPDCAYPFKELCGCGVGLKFVQALCLHYHLPDTAWMEYLDLVAIAIAADIVPIVDENRILTYFGLKKVNSHPSKGIKALLDLSNMQGEIHVNNLVFVIAPRVNAAGRMDDAKKAVELFIANDEDAARSLAEQLHSDNTDRREVDSSITEQALVMIETQDTLRVANSTLLYHPDWGAVSNELHEPGKAKGVVGIVASRLIEKYYRPTIILTDSGDKVAGSARSVSGFNVYEAIHQCRELLENYGGHFYAAGLTLKRENVEALRIRFEEVVSANITADMLIPEIVIDTVIRFTDITLSFYRILCQMEPFGPENMRPVFIAKQVYETGKSRIVKEQHVKFELKQGSAIMGGIGFGLASKFNLLEPNVPLDVVFTLDENEWNGEKKIQLKVIDIRHSDENYN
jgi:single-stranded-DNA-specific exonuclease